jgi:4-hydroxy-tetrahydrodipicolinate synthase
LPSHRHHVFDDGKIDYRSIDRPDHFYAQVGMQRVTVLGILGEAPKLRRQWSLEVATLLHQSTTKNLQIIVGVSAPGLRRYALARRHRWMRARLL